MPINYKEYHPAWKEISKSVIDDANNKCELCHAPNGYDVYRPTKNYSRDHVTRPWYFWYDQEANTESCNKKTTKIVLTVHHIDGNKNNNKRVNLLALCQKCHLRLDLERHILNRKINKSKQGVNHE